MAVPKRKLSRSRVRRRRSRWVAELEAPVLVICPRCHKRKQPHRICPHCGFYRGEFIRAPITPEKEK